MVARDFFAGALPTIFNSVAGLALLMCVTSLVSGLDTFVERAFGPAWSNLGMGIAPVIARVALSFALLLAFCIYAPALAAKVRNPIGQRG
jgi:hypothetical protein